jgi:alpha/beta superfamily hydrolase
MIRFIFLTMLLAVSSRAVAHTLDYEREARWRSEVVPGLVVGDAVDIPGPGKRPFLGLLTEPAGIDRGAATLIVIVHGIGVHPDHGIIGKLRMDLADQGFPTLSIQMPVLPSEAPSEHYEPFFGNAADRIASAAAWSRGQGYARSILVSHSLGSRMANAYFDRAPTAAFRGWVALGLGGAFTPAFSPKPTVPVLDVLGERDLEPVLKAAPARERVARASGAHQRKIAGADHFYAGRESELVGIISDFARQK